jgi:hypothetical protein
VVETIQARDRNSSEDSLSLFYACCPITGKRGRADCLDQVPVPGGQAIWWHCLACGGWHVNLLEEQPPQKSTLSHDDIFHSPSITDLTTRSNS